jgi:fido (protein-threonine AMPylation protein)
MASRSQGMFGSVFEWAGDFRNVNIRKSGDDDSSDGLFAPSGRLVADGQRAVRNLENTVRRIQTAKISLIADNLADVYDQLIPTASRNDRRPSSGRD